ncbi:unnamed protein product [Cyclocybe aegerita]|uniref:Serine aminopeptidase S33 domain-containing protein n=1 Tax=Cyclocybe aegerita TaxID=1973307 RepID=A0A8S0W2D3_CYCAE|nr:unnamed protein product [Cyclocybe aegerita]
MSTPTSFEKTTIQIPSKTPEWNLDTWRFLPAGGYAKPYPVIVMAPGFTCTKRMSLEAYAETFASNGYACLLFDYRRWGTSDGTPRNVVDINEQMEDYKAVIKYARQNSEEYDGSRVVLWGTSFSGGHVIRLGSDQSLSLSAIIASNPYVGGSVPITFNFGLVKTSAYVLAGIIKKLFGMFGASEPVYIQSAGRPGEVAAMTTAGVLEAVKSMAPEESDWENRVAASSIPQVLFYNPLSYSSSVKIPILVMICGADIECSPVRAKLASEKVQQGESHTLVGSSHEGLYAGKKFFGEASEKELEFLKRVVPV